MKWNMALLLLWLGGGGGREREEGGGKGRREQGNGQGIETVLISTWAHPLTVVVPEAARRWERSNAMHARGS